MYVFLPSEDSSLAEFARDLTAENWQKWSTRFRSRPGQVGLPRFKVESQFDVRSTLKSMGLQRAFESFAAFSPLAPQGAKLVSASQSTSLSVDERGTEAISVGWSAGVVGGVPGGQLAPPPTPFEMIVDRPFFFAIVNQPTGQILFMGSVVDP